MREEIKELSIILDEADLSGMTGKEMDIVQKVLIDDRDIALFNAIKVLAKYSDRAKNMEKRLSTKIFKI